MNRQIRTWTIGTSFADADSLPGKLWKITKLLEKKPDNREDRWKKRWEGKANDFR